MTIGELLKEKRLAENKTQKEWAGNIISTSYYAKVEKNQHRIAAEDLLAILEHNDLSTEDFFKELTDKKDELREQINTLNNIAVDATYHSDIKRIEETLQLVRQTALPQKKKEEIILVYKGLIETIKITSESNYHPNKAVTEGLKDKIFSIPNFNEFKLELYANFMDFYDYKTNIMITNQIVNKIKQFKSDKELLAVTTILSNLISQLVDKKRYKETLPFIKVAEKFPIIPDLYLPMTAISLYKYLVNYHFNQKQEDLDKAEMIARTYFLTGLEDIGKSILNIINKEKSGD